MKFSLTRVHVYIQGRVQGVFYRHWTKKLAQRFGIVGWVRNLEDGRVEAIFEGEKGKIEKMIAACKKGPPLAFVSHIDVIKEEATGEFSGFAIKN